MNEPKIIKTPVQLMLSITKQTNETPNNKKRIVVVKMNKKYMINLLESSSETEIA